MEGLKVLIGAINALKDDVSFQDLKGVLSEGEDLRKQLDSQETIIKQLKSDREQDQEKYAFTTRSLIDEHQKACTKLRNDRDELLKEAFALKESIKKRDESRKELDDQHARMRKETASLKKDLDSSHAFGQEQIQKYLKLERDLGVAQREVDELKAASKTKDDEIRGLRESKVVLEKGQDGMRHSLRLKTQELKQLRDMAVDRNTEPIATIKEMIEGLWRDALFIVDKHFRFKLPDASEQNVEMSKRLKEVLLNVSKTLDNPSDLQLPLPRQDSEAARNMRCTLVLAWLMRLVDDAIFQPNYIIPLYTGIRQELLHEAMKDSLNESFRRAFLLSIFPDEQKRIVNDRTASVCNHIMCLVEGIIEFESANSLKSELQAFLKSASSIWHTIQRHRDRFEPDMTYAPDESTDWTTLPLQNSGPSKLEDTPAVNGEPDEAMLVIFPRLYLVKDAEPKPVTSGIVLMRSQTLAAAQEVRNEAPKSPTFGRGSHNWSRSGGRKDSIMGESLANRNVATFLAQGAPNGQLH